LKDEGFWPEREFELREGGVEYVVDLAIQCQQGTVAIAVGDRAAPSNVLRDPDLETVRRAVQEMGGIDQQVTQEALVLANPRVNTRDPQ
jgi:hypothetical protein